MGAECCHCEMVRPDLQAYRSPTTPETRVYDRAPVEFSNHVVVKRNRTARTLPAVTYTDNGLSRKGRRQEAQDYA